MLLNPLTFHAPKKLSEAIELYYNLDNVKIQAGGTFLLNSLKLMKRKGTKTPNNVLSLYKVDELKGISLEDDTMTIKSMTTIDDLFESDQLKGNLSVFRTVCKNISTQPIRNMATVGGNLTCRYTWTEMPAVMIGLQATMHFIDQEGKEHTLPAEEFYKNAAKTDKIFTHVTIKKDDTATVSYRRVKKTQFVDIPMLSLLIRTNFKNDKFSNTIVSVNNCVDFAQRDAKLEEFLNTASIGEKTADEALDHLDNTIYDKRSSDYKKHIFQVNIKSAINELISQKTKK